MRKTIATIVVLLAASMTNGYVYSYQNPLSVNYQGNGDVPKPIKAGPNPPADMSSNLTIATLDSATYGLGMTPAENAGRILPANIEQFPAPLAIVVDSPTALLGPNATPLSVGDTVGPNSTWGSLAWIYGYLDPPSNLGNAAFLSLQGAYVGIQFPDNNNQIHYGWLLVRYDQPAGTYFGTLELLQAGYETDPGVAITVAPEPTIGSILFVSAIISAFS